MWLEARISQGTVRSLVLPTLLLACLAVTHHASAMLCFSYLVGVAGIESMRRHARTGTRVIGGLALLAFAILTVWIAFPGNPIGNYLSSAFMRQANALFFVISGHS